MIGRIAGVILHRAADHVLIDVRGVGYIVHVSERTAASLPRVGDAIGAWMPFQDGLAWATDSAGSEFSKAFDTPANIIWFIVFSLILWAAGLVALHKRDA